MDSFARLEIPPAADGLAVLSGDFGHEVEVAGLSGHGDGEARGLLLREGDGADVLLLRHEHGLLQRGVIGGR